MVFLEQRCGVEASATTIRFDPVAKEYVMGASLLCCLFLLVHWAAQCRCLVYDVVRDTVWPEDEAGTSCNFVTDGQLVLQPGCFAASTVSGEALSKMRDKEDFVCKIFTQGEFFQLDFSVRREDSIWCAQVPPSPIITTLGVNEQTVVKVLSDYHTEPQSFTFVTLLESTAPLDVSFTSLFADHTIQTKGHQQCFSQIALFNVTLKHLSQPCKVEISLVSSVQEEVLVDPSSAAGTSTDECALLGTPDAVILHKISIAPPHIASSPTSVSSLPVRVFCGIYTTANEHSTRIHTIRTTWGHKCTTFLAFSTTTDPTVPSVYVPHIGEEKYANMWQKIRSIWKYIYAHYRAEYDFFLLCGDDSYFIMENLHAYLNSEYIQNLRSLGQGLFMGRKLHSPVEHHDVIFNSGGAGYLLDQRALHVLMSLVDTEQCRAHVLNEASEDVNVARCLASAEPPVLPIDTRDEQGEQRFHPFSPGVTVLYQPASPPPTLDEDWYYHYDAHAKFGMACCSANSVSFHYLSPQEMVHIYNYMYNCDDSVKNEYYNANGQLYFERYRKYGQLAR